MNNVMVYISYDENYPLWDDVILVNKKDDLNIKEFIDNLINAIEWSTDKKVSALKIESSLKDTSSFDYTTARNVFEYRRKRK